jgi:putative glutamine amidotransferase
VKVVAVSQRVDVLADRGERRDALDQRVCAWLASAGYLAAPVPNGLASRDKALSLWLQTLRPHAVVLSGGGNIGESPERDHTERHLLAWANTHGIPLLGICRGMQMMTISAGGQLRPVVGHVRTRHLLRGTITGEANSYHNFALLQCPPDFKVLATSEDFVIEAFRHITLPWEGWMWHPEREVPFIIRDQTRLRLLFGE